MAKTGENSRARATPRMRREMWRDEMANEGYLMRAASTRKMANSLSRLLRLRW